MEIKKVLLILTLLSTSTFAIGQSYVGVFAGANMAKLQGDVPAKGKYKTSIGANVGALVDINLGKGIFLSLQPSFSQEGTKVAYTVQGQRDPVDSVSIRLNYVSLPILLKITSTNERFYAIGGIETAALLSSSETIGEETGEIDGDVTEWNLALQFGVGMHIPIGKPRLFVELRYGQGLVNLTDEPLDNTSIPRVKTTGLKIFVGIDLPLNFSKN